MDSSIWITALLIFVVVDLLIVVYVVWKRGQKGFSPQEKRKFQSHWQKIKTDKDLRHAIMDADKLLDMGLKGKGYEGSLGEKLKQSGALFRDLNGVWAAHKLRNRLAHELHMKLSDGEAKRALRHFERAYRDLGML